MNEQATGDIIVTQRRSWREIVRSFSTSVVALAVLALFLHFTVAAAITNFAELSLTSITHVVVWLASALWLAIVALFLGYALFGEEGLVRTLARNPVIFLRVFSTCLFVRAFAEPGHANVVRFGFRMFRREFFYAIVTVPQIARVTWHAGQATSLAGKDKNDWSVILWFEHGDTRKAKWRKKWARRPELDSLAVGPCGHKERVEAFGREFVAFIERFGARLVPGHDERTFLRAQKYESSTSELT